ncbi:M1 family aminopeptidase [Rufibacter ruber]|uniref:M61 family metallopeptidase n=1 Tax=Rufibacter ruber TaxID=1783499 RepID=UPI001379D468|nr:M1 family aminopeptidase [Rufibacter ruber]
MRLFLVPENLFQSDSDSARIEINWAAPAAGHIFHSNFGPGLRQKANLTKDMLYSTFFIGGDFRRYSYSWKNQTIYLVTRGNWSSFTDQQVLDILKATIPAQMVFWKDRLDAPFSVSLLPTFEEWTDSSKSFSLGGSGLLNSFISFSSNNPGTELKMLRWLYNHELLHRWIGQTLVNEEEEKQYWFSEGFTDYYAYKLMLRNKQISLEDFLDVINKEVLAPHYQSPVRTLPNSELTQQKFWSDRQYNKLPYRRGLLYALLLDSQLKKKYHGKKSLDNLMKNLMAQAKKSGDFKFNHTVFQDQLDTYLGSAAITEFGRYILQGNWINFEESLPAGLLLETQKDIPAIIISPLANKKKLADLLGK